MLEKVIESDDESTEQVYYTVEKELNSADKSRKLFYDIVKQVLLDCGKCLDNPKLTPEEQKQICEQEIRILRIADNKDKEIREHEMEAMHLADRKDIEKRAFNWKAVVTASTIVVAFIGMSGVMLNGKFKLKLPIL